MIAVTAFAAEKLPYLDKLPPLIDREVFFGDPEIARGQISPDGKYIFFGYESGFWAPATFIEELRPKEGKVSDPRPMTESR